MVAAVVLGVAYTFHIRAFAGRQILPPAADLRSAPDPLATARVLSMVGGNGVEFVFPIPGDASTIEMINDSCADYWAHVVITAVPADGGAGATD